MPTSRSPLAVLIVIAFASLAVSGCFKASQSASNDLVSSVKYTKLVVEVDYVDGYRPAAAAVSLLEQRMQERLSKPGGITIEQTAVESSRSTYSVNDLRAMESQHRDRQPTGDTMVLYVLYVNGGHSSDTGSSQVLGVQYGRASIAIFKETVRESEGLGAAFGSTEVEQAVLVHEFGHAAGLVNNGLPMVDDHEDPDHPKHSRNPDSVMYWAVENTFGLDSLTGNIPKQFDSNDIADFRAGGGK